MKTPACLIAIALLLASCSTTREPETTHAQPASVIFDTDMGPDYDDVGAMAMLHAFADSGKAEILATVASTGYQNVAAVLDVLNTYFGRPDIPIGVPGEGAVMLRDFQHWSDTLVDRYPHRIRSNAAARDATELYRAILSAQPDSSVTIITVGFLTNIAALMKSPPDAHAPLDGHALMKKKVRQLVSMAGKFPEGTEFNIEEDADAAKFVFDHVEVPVLLSGFEIGEKVKSGLPLLRNAHIQHSPVKDVYRIAVPMAAEDSAGRMSWDQTAVLVGVRGPAPYYNVNEGRMVVAADGSNRWTDEGRGHKHLVENRPVADVEKLINELMMHQPVAPGAPVDD